MLAELLDLIEDNFTIDVESTIVNNALNQPMVKVAIGTVGYSIVDNLNGTYEVGVFVENGLEIHENLTADEVIGIITPRSNKVMLHIMENPTAVKHGVF